MSEYCERCGNPMLDRGHSVCGHCAREESELAPAHGSVDLRALQLAIECNLEKIERVLGPNYKLTLLAKYQGPLPLKDADILLTKDSRENMIAVIDRFFPPNVRVSESGGDKPTT